MDLRNKGIVITGASSGLGLALAKRLIKAGAKVVGVSRNPEKLKKLYGDKVYTIACDISKQNELDAMLEEAEGFLGGIDIFVANAGFAYYGPIGSP
ncbi:MAG: SDR family NAD(P)-dependent oxidoreductase, partial [Peptococcia bacterium]